jgi:hypothetical protein
MDEIDWSYLEPSRKLEMPSEGLPAEADTNRETPELETARVVHEMVDTPILEMSTRDTSSNLTLRNYITDIISQPGAVAGPDISNELLPEVQDVAFRFPVNETPLRESSSTTTRKPIQSIGPSSILNNDNTKGVSSLSGTSLRGGGDFPNSISNNDNEDTVSPISTRGGYSTVSSSDPRAHSFFLFSFSATCSTTTNPSSSTLSDASSTSTFLPTGFTALTPPPPHSPNQSCTNIQLSMNFNINITANFQD